MSQAILECPLCLNEFDTYERVPKILSCGHTVCLACVECLDQPNGPNCCGKSKLTDVINKDNLQTNAFFIEMMEKSIIQQQTPRTMSQLNQSNDLSQQYATPMRKTQPLANQSQFLNSTKIAKISEHLQTLQQDLEGQRNSSLNALDKRITELENLLQEKQSHHSFKFESINTVLQKLQRQSEEQLKQINFYFQQNQSQQEVNQKFLKEFQDQENKIQSLEQILREIQNQSNSMSSSEFRLEDELKKLANEKEYIESKYNQQVQSLTAKTNKNYIKMQEMQKSVEEMQKKLNDTNQELQKQKLYNSQNQFTIEQQQEYIQQLSQDNELLKQFQEDRMQSITNSQEILKEQLNQNERLKEQIEFLKEEIEKLDQLQPLTQELQEENEKLNQKVQTIMQQPDKAEQLQKELSQIKNMLSISQDEKLQKESEVSFYREKLEDIHNQLEELQNENQNLLTIMQEFEQIKVKCVCHQLQKENEALKSRKSPVGNVVQDFQNVQERDQMMIFQLQGSPREQPISQEKLFQIIENVFDRKNKGDQEDILSGMKPQYFTNYFYEFLLTKNNGVEQATQQQLNQILLRLKQLYTEKQKYGILICRYLQLFHNKPFDLVLTTFLLKLRTDFKKLTEAFIKRQEIKAQKSKGQMPDLQTEYGGLISLIDAFILINTIFDSDKLMALTITNQLLPIKKRVDFLMNIIIWKMTRYGKAPSQIFQMIDRSKKGILDHNEFVQGISNQIQIFFTEEEMEILLNYLDGEGNGSIEYQEFVDKINQLYSKIVNKDAWTITVADLQNAIAEAYFYKQQQDNLKIQSLFVECDADQDGILEQSEFFDFIQKLDTENQLDSLKLQKVHKEALQLSENQDGVKLNPMIYVSWKYSLGDIGCQIFGAEQVLSGVERMQEDYFNYGEYGTL